MGKLGQLALKRAAAKRKAKAAADAAAAADATAAAAPAIAAADAAIDAASRAAAAAVVPATCSSFGVATRRSYAAAVANGPAVAGETISVNAATVASPSSAATRLSKKPKLSAAVVIPAATADCTGDATAPDLAATANRTGDATAPDLVKKDLKKKSPKFSCELAASVERGATDASVLSKSRYPSRGTGTMTSTGKGASSSPVAEDDAHPLVPAGKIPKTAAKSTAAKSNEL